MIDFTGKSENVVSERDMIFSFNNGEIKIYLSYETGELKKIEIEDKLEKYWADVKTVYLKEGKKIFLEVEIWEGYLLFFDDEYRMAGFGIKIGKNKNFEKAEL